MSDTNKETNWKEILLIPIIIALISGGSSPWWWDKVFDSESQSLTNSSNNEKVESSDQIFLMHREEYTDRTSRAWIQFAEYDGKKVTIEYDVTWDSTRIVNKSYSRKFEVPFSTPYDNFVLVFNKYDPNTEGITVEIRKK